MRKKVFNVCFGLTLRAIGLLKKGSRRSRQRKQGEVLFRQKNKRESMEQKKITVPVFTPKKIFH